MKVIGYRLLANTDNRTPITRHQRPENGGIKVRKLIGFIIFGIILISLSLVIGAEETKSIKEGDKASYGMVSIPAAMEAYSLKVSLNKPANGFAIYPAKIEDGYLKKASSKPVISGKASARLGQTLPSGIYALEVKGSSGAVATLTYRLRRTKK